MVSLNLSFFKNKRVLITGHTGFKGSWLCCILKSAGAIVTGYALEAPTEPSLFELAKVEEGMNSIIGDIRDLSHLMQVFDEFQPEIVIHLAAQPIVRTSYEDPVGTYATNVMGTVNICECVRKHSSVRSFLNVTTDKVYKNIEQDYHYKEDDYLDGFDPYSNSKSCSELVTHSYINSFFADMNLAVSTARAGNVIGGGDFAKDRIVPDCVRATINGDAIEVRNPNSIRPYQHVLEPLAIYLTVVKAQYEDKTKAGFYNVGPSDDDCITTGKLADEFCKCWGEGASWITHNDNGPHEAGFLKLDSSLVTKTFGYHPVWRASEAISHTVEWYKAYAMGKDVLQITLEQIGAFFND